MVAVEKAVKVGIPEAGLLVLSWRLVYRAVRVI